MPTLVKEVFNIIKEIHNEGTTILLVEQNARKALAIAEYAYVIETGEIVLEGPASEIRENDQVRKSYLGER
jgi:branched-chain amino acid transport system ATP-binding protein